MDAKELCTECLPALRKHLGERDFRMVVAAMAMSQPHGGITVAAKASGLSRPTIHSGICDLKCEPPELPGAGRQRKSGGGRKQKRDADLTLEADLRKIVSPYEKGDPESPLLWSSKSLRKLAGELNANGHSVGYVTVGKMLTELGFTLQSNRKSHEGGNGLDRDAQFKNIARSSQLFMDLEQPVISVDAKKKELVGNFKNNGREYHPSGKPEEVNVYDFINENGKATPYGVYDQRANEGFVNVGISHDTAVFAVDSIRRWWSEMGSVRYPHAHSLMMTADGGGSNGSRNRRWKIELQKFADETDLTVHVCHFPPGTSKWNKIEHRMFSAISMNWRGKPLVSIEVIVSLIAATTTKTGLRIKAEKSDKEYECGQKVLDEQMQLLNITTSEFHPEWNYAISPSNRKDCL